MEFFWHVMLLFAAISITAIGVFMLFSAISGKGISEPKRETSLGLWIQYKARGIIGFCFVVIGGMILLLFIKRL